MKKTIALVILLSVILGSIMVFPAHADDPKVVAHWKLQNVEGYYVGDIDKDDLQFIDLSGNGNDLVTRSVGKGSELDIFTWDDGMDKGATKTASSLKMNNSKILSAAVDPYTESETSWTGGYTSGKYLETIKGSPMNTNEFEEGFSVDIIFKISPDIDNDYNRYCGLFSRQGVIPSQNEPPFSIALSEWKDDPATGTIGSNKTWMQYVHCDEVSKVNNEMDGILLGADEWHHLLVSSDGFSITYYIDSEPLATFTDIPYLFYTDPNFSWEVGVGRKNFEGHENDCKNEDCPEGVIRRLFCGSIAEIRVMDGPIEPDDSLFAKTVEYTNIPGPATAKDYDPSAATSVEETTAEPADDTTDPVTAEEDTKAPDNDTTAAATDADVTTAKPAETKDTGTKAPDDRKGKSNVGLIIGIVAGVVVVAGAAAAVIIGKKKKNNRGT